MTRDLGVCGRMIIDNRSGCGVAQIDTDKAYFGLTHVSILPFSTLLPKPTKFAQQRIGNL